LRPRLTRLALLAVGILAIPLFVTNANADTGPVVIQAAPTAQQLLAKVAGCPQISAGRFAQDSGGTANIPVCGTRGSRTAPVWWRADMDIDCDGIRTSNCNEQTDCCFLPDTSLHQADGRPMQSDLTHYMVIPQNSAAAWHFQDAGVRLGDVAAVIFQGRLLYAVFADTGPTNIIGEGSYALARDLGINPNPSTGGVGGTGVTYIVFPNSRPTSVSSNTAITTKGQQVGAAFAGT
jgi:hypothetical protein